MYWLFWVSLLLTCLPVTESTIQSKNCLVQPNKLMWRTTGQRVLLKCIVSSHCSANSLHYVWFTFKKHVHLRLDPSSNPLKYSMHGACLNITSLNANDTGVYFCAAESGGQPAPGEQHIGSGTTLVVKEKIPTVWPILLWVSFIILAIYSLALVTLIIKKHGCNMDICRTYKPQNNSTKKAQFRDVLQEMRSRKWLARDKNAVSRNRSQAEPASTEPSSSTNDIYQNV